jgi:hypothetical protein
MSFSLSSKRPHEHPMLFALLRLSQRQNVLLFSKCPALLSWSPEIDILDLNARARGCRYVHLSHIDERLSHTSTKICDLPKYDDIRTCPRVSCRLRPFETCTSALNVLRSPPSFLTPNQCALPRMSCALVFERRNLAICATVFAGSQKVLNSNT